MQFNDTSLYVMYVSKYSVPCMHNQVLRKKSGKKCDKTMKSTLFIRAPVIAARLSHAAFRRRAKRDMIAKSFQYIPQNAKLSTLFNRIECSPSARIFKYS